MIPTCVLVALSSIATLATHTVPDRTPLHIRLTTTVGSYASVRGSEVSAVLIAPVISDGRIVLPAGSILSGEVKSVTRVGLGLRHETAALNLAFDRITPPEQTPISMAARVSEVDNARERTNADGSIQGVRSTGSICNRVAGYIRMALQWEIHAELAVWAFRSLLMEVPEPEIYYPAGVEMTLVLSDPLLVPANSNVDETGAQEISGESREDLARIAAALPYRTQVPATGRSSDFTNLLFVGSEQELVTAFEAAGWTQPRPASWRDGLHWVRAIAEGHGDGEGSMSIQFLNGVQSDLAWEKGFDDVAKRHHIRIWKLPEQWQGRDMWIGAATHDVDIAYMRRGKAVSHRIDAEIDQERDKVAYDLAFSECANILAWIDRADFPRSAMNATGDPVVSDGRVAVVELEDSAAPRLASASTGATNVPAHGSLLQRLLRREILSARNEILRTNPYWRSVDAGRLLIEAVRHREQKPRDSEAASNSDGSSAAGSAPAASALVRFARSAEVRMQ